MDTQLMEYFDYVSIEPIFESKKGTFDQIKFSKALDILLKRIEKTAKLEKILSANAESIEDPDEKAKIIKLIEKCREIIRGQADLLEALTKKNIDKVDVSNPEKADIELNAIKDEVEQTGVDKIDGISINDDIEEKAKEIEKQKGKQLDRDAETQSKKKGKTSDAEKSKTFKGSSTKRIIVSRLLNALRLSLLPEVDGESISKAGGYFLLYGELLKKQKSWMEPIIKELFKDSEEKQTIYLQGEVESPEESDQLAYLSAIKEWLKDYIESDLDGELDVRTLDKQLDEVEKVVEEKEKEIRNFYTSKDFNMGQFKGLRIKPEIRIPIYSKVDLAVSYKDRLNETPLKKYYVGFSSIIGGLLSAIPDRGDIAFAKKAYDRNMAVVNGINSIISATAGAVGGKQASRDYETGVKNAVKQVGDTLSTKVEKSAKASANPTYEDFVGSMVQPVVNTPGQLMQTPDSIPGGMDTFALLGPGKKENTKKKKKKKPASPYLVNNGIMKFEDFIKSKK
jgi:hypothetical protein